MSEFQKKLSKVCAELEQLIGQKNLAYGDSYRVVPAIIRVLYPKGISPEQFENALVIIRVLDKLKRIVENNDPFGENPWQDVAGYAILQLVQQKPKPSPVGPWQDHKSNRLSFVFGSGWLCDAPDCWCCSTNSSSDLRSSRSGAQPLAGVDSGSRSGSKGSD